MASRLSRVFDLNQSAREEMLHRGFDPDFSADAERQVRALQSAPSHWDAGLRDLRDLPWSSIDNDSSRDLDQLEVAERIDGGIRVRVAIADVDRAVPVDSPIDKHAASQATTVYTPVRVFPMLPEQLSTDLTSLNGDADRAAIAVEFVVDEQGCIASSDVYGAIVRNKAALAYNAVGAWLAGTGPAPAKVSDEVAAQLRLQDEAAQRLRAQRFRLGAIDFDRVEAEPVIADGQVKDIEARRKNRATDLIENFMIAANEVMARKLAALHVSNIRRVVKSPERWPRIVDLAAHYGAKLPDAPDSAALAAFLNARRQKDPLHYPDLSLAIVKLMGPGEYVLSKPGEPGEGHFGLAAHDYTHATAPNRRFADLVTQRLLKAATAGQQPPYSDDQLAAIATHCTEREDAARKVERAMGKRAAAVAYQNRAGESFDAIVTGVTPKGVFVRTISPPIEGRLMHGEQGLDVGDRVHVKLVNTDPRRGFIDFAR